MKKGLLVSIIIPCYNQALYLEECLQSVLDQTYNNWECIIVNDSSPDNTQEVALNWCKKDDRFIYLEKENGGLSSARNFGINKAKGNWILPLDADDYISENYLELAAVHFKKENIKVIYCKAEKFGIECGEWILPKFSIKELAIQNIIFCTAFFKKEDWRNIGGYDEKMKSGCEDWDFWISILKNYDERAVIKIEQICFFYRIKESSMVKSITSKKHNQIYTYIEKKHIDFFFKHLGNLHSLYRIKNQYEKDFNRIYNSKRYKIGNFLANIFNR